MTTLSHSPHRRKLIEVSLPLNTINKASKREPSGARGHPSTFHHWWARRPLASCRAVLFSQLVDDPSSWPEEFPTEEAQTAERDRLHKIIEQLVPWKNSNKRYILEQARWEIARSIARGRGERTPPRDDPDAVLNWLACNAPPVCDPFCGGGSIPLEAQRLGLKAHGSDLNPVAVLVSKATCEIPPKFAGRQPVNPARDLNVAWNGARGLAEDIRHFGKWMRDKAEASIGHLYPKVPVTKAMAAARSDLEPWVGQELTVIAWFWVHTVASPDPMLRGAHVPLASSFVLSSKKGMEAVVVPEVCRESVDYSFTVKAGGIEPEELARAQSGARAGGGANFTCLISGTLIQADYIKTEGKAGRMDARLMAVVTKGKRGRVYLDPTDEMEEVARSAEPEWSPGGEVPRRLTGGTCYGYGLTTFAALFTDRQLVALTTLSDLVAEAREKVLADALAAGMAPDATRLADGGTGACAYADAVATYLGLCVSRQVNRSSKLSRWHTGGAKVEHVFARQALPMVWDFCEANPFSNSSGSFVGQVDYLANVVDNSPAAARSAVIQQATADDTGLGEDAIIATDPPYYGNISYADLSDFFYVWQRRTLRDVWPDLFRRVLVPKNEELVASPYRHGGKEEAEQFFMDGMRQALLNMHQSGASAFPVTLYYAFKETELSKEGLTSPGWATFLQGLVDVGYIVDGTWPIKTELPNRMIASGANALASSIVLVCRKRPVDAPVITRREFIAKLRSQMPDALAKIRSGGVGPVDMAQASIGPGMGVFTAASKVLEADDSTMTVRTAIALINQVRDEIGGEEAAGYDPDTRFCIEWFEAFGARRGTSGEAITMAQAYGISIDDLNNAGVFSARAGEARLLLRKELPPDWDPQSDTRLTAWECAQHLVRVLEASEGGLEAAARLYGRMPPEQGEAARQLAYRLYDICERTGRASEAQAWNMLVSEWAALEGAVSAPDQEPSFL